MLLSKVVKIKMCGKIFKKYYSKYGPYKRFDVIEIDIKDLSNSSKSIISSCFSARCYYW